MTKFKKNEKVRIRTLTHHERYGQQLYYNGTMMQSEGLEGIVIEVVWRDYGYIYRVKTELDDRWLWMENWLEKLDDVQYIGY